MKIVYKVVGGFMLANLLSGCGGSDAKDEVPKITLTASAAVKEKRTITISATASDDKSVSGYDWQQLSGPPLVLAQTKTAAVSVTAPAVDSDATALLRLTVTDSGGQTAQSDVTISITNNKMPVVTVTNSSNPEKSTVQLKATASDSDGSISSFSWKQTSGPTVQLTGADTATASFVAPAVANDTQLTFSFQATDDDKESSTASGTVTVTQKFVSYTISATAPANSFANASGVFVVGGTQSTIKTNAQGEFSTTFKLDDDQPAPDLAHVTVTSATVTGLEYALFIRDFLPAPAVVSTANEIAAAQAGKSLVVSEASTALFALIKQSNNGAVPTTLADFILLEKTIDADEMLESAAVAKIVAQGSVALPPNTTLLQLLANDTAYSAFVTAIEKADPGSVSRSITAILTEQNSKLALTAAEIPSVFYQTWPTGERFFSYGGFVYQFNTDGTGLRSDATSANLGSPQPTDRFSWRIVDGELELVFAADSGGTALVFLDDPRVQTLGAATIKRLQDNRISQVEVRWRDVKSQLKRILDGAKIDTFRATVQTSYDILPIQLSDGILDPGPLLESTTANILLKSGGGSNALAFTDKEISGNAFNLVHQYTAAAVLTSAPLAQQNSYQMDLLEFNAGGVGVGLLSQMSFSWNIDASGKLVITFADGTKAEAIKIDEGYGSKSSLTTLFDSNNKLQRQEINWMVNRDKASLAGFKLNNQENLYWQAMLGTWKKECWYGNQLYLACGTALSRYFGFQFTSDNSYQELGTSAAGRTSSVGRAWRTSADGNTFEINRTNTCTGCAERPRIWWPIKLENIGGKRRVWLLEAQYWVSPATTVFPFRITVYDELPKTTPDAPALLTAAERRLVLQPSQSSVASN